MSIIAEAIHSLMDLAAAVVTFFPIRIASRPADESHPYGHEKVENVSGVLEADALDNTSAPHPHRADGRCAFGKHDAVGEIE